MEEENEENEEKDQRKRIRVKVELESHHYLSIIASSHQGLWGTESHTCDVLAMNMRLKK